MTTCAGVKPGSTPARWTIVRSSRPAALASSSDIASCAVTSPRCSRWPDAIRRAAAGRQPGLKRRPAETERRQDTSHQRRGHGQRDGDVRAPGHRDARRSEWSYSRGKSATPGSEWRVHARPTPRIPPTHGEQQAFGRELPHETPAPCAERGARGELRQPRRAARQQQVRDVQRGDEQHDGDDSQDDGERSSERPPERIEALRTGARRIVKSAGVVCG